MPRLNLTYEALHPTAYSSVRRSSSLRFRRQVRLVVLNYFLMREMKEEILAIEAANISPNEKYA